MPIDFSPSLTSLAAWAVLAGIPVGIIALYFLKLRRKPVQVASTLLWRRSLEDLHVNSLFQRLRRNLLLFLQLLAVFLVLLALLGPRMKGAVGQGARYVLAIDNSASMNATDVSPTRLAFAKAEAKKVVDAMQSDDLAMVIAFSDRAKVVSNYTGNLSLLKKRIDDIEPTEASTSLRDALQVAAGLANPNKVGDVPEGVVATSIVSPKLLIYTDGGFPDVDGFQLGNIEPEVVIIGKPAPQIEAKVEEGKPAPLPPSNNLAILALQTRRNDEKPDIYQVFGRVHNYKSEDVETEAKLFVLDPTKPKSPGTLRDAVALKVPAQGDAAFKFDLPDVGATELEVKLTIEDDLASDNRAFTLIGNPRKAQVLVVTAGNKYLNDALKTPLSDARADVTTVSIDAAKGDAVKRDMASGRYDLVIFDQFRPEKNPEANALYFGALPPGPNFEKTKDVTGPTILDVNGSHPLMQFIRDLSVVLVNKATIPTELPNGSTPLIESNGGPLAFITPREGFSDTVITFALLDSGQGVNTDWVRKFSFPLFMYNALQVIGNARDSAGEEVHAPAQPVSLRPETINESVKVTNPEGAIAELKRSAQGGFIYNDTSATGLYHVNWTPTGSMAFAVNEFDTRESDLAPRGLVPEGTAPSEADKYRIKIGYNPVTSAGTTSPTPRDWWKPIAALALGILLLEWYIYNKRVYI